MERIIGWLEALKLAYSQPRSVADHRWISEELEKSDGVFGSKQTQHDVMMAMNEQERLYGEMGGEMTTELLLIGVFLVTLWFLNETSVYHAILLITFVLWLLTKRRQTVMYTQIKHLQGYIDGCVETMLFTTRHLEKMQKEIKEETEAEPVVQ
jgi:hypothetical protein